MKILITGGCGFVGSNIAVYLKKKLHMIYNNEIKEALTFNKELLLENFINPNKLRFPLFRNILESYYK